MIDNFKLQIIFNGKETIVELTESHYFKSVDITVPKGFQSDGASIPKMFWFISHPLDRDSLPGSIVHDYFYRKGVDENIENRKEADLIFKKLLKENGTDFLKRNLFYWAVRIFGGKYYKVIEGLSLR